MSANQQYGLYYPCDPLTPPIVTQHVFGAPIDEKTAVHTYDDLLDPNTWGTIEYGYIWNLGIYLGMIVSVVDDQDHPENNGIYWLREMPKENDYYRVSSNDRMQITGWEKIGSGTQVDVDNESIKFDPNQTPGDSDDNQIWVNMVDGGANWGSQNGN